MKKHSARKKGPRLKFSIIVSTLALGTFKVSCSGSSEEGDSGDSPLDTRLAQVRGFDTNNPDSTNCQLPAPLEFPPFNTQFRVLKDTEGEEVTYFSQECEGKSSCKAGTRLGPLFQLDEVGRTFKGTPLTRWSESTSPRSCLYEVSTLSFSEFGDDLLFSLDIETFKVDGICDPSNFKPEEREPTCQTSVNAQAKVVK